METPALYKGEPIESLSREELIEAVIELGRAYAKSIRDCEYFMIHGIQMGSALGRYMPDGERDDLLKENGVQL